MKGRLRGIRRAAGMISLLLALLAFPSGTGLATGTRLPILMYHKVNPWQTRSKLDVSPANFERQMAYLQRHGYRPIPLEQGIAYLRSGRIPSRAVVITLDDGYRDNYQFAFPILKKYDFKATIFLPVDGLGRTSYWDRQVNPGAVAPLLSLAQVREMQAYGITFGSHTMNHPFLTKVPAAEAERQITQSKQRLERLLGRPVTVFAYPYGAWNPVVSGMVRAAGYVGAVTVQQGWNDSRTDRFALRRLRVLNRPDYLEVLLSRPPGEAVQ